MYNSLEFVVGDPQVTLGVGDTFVIELMHDQRQVHALHTSMVSPGLSQTVWWLINPVYVDNAFDENLLLNLLAWAFIPRTVLMYLFIYPGGIADFDWSILILGILADVASYAGGLWGNRYQVPGYTD